MSGHVQLAQKISDMFSEIYFYCHPKFDVELSHQAVRALHYIGMKESVQVQKIAEHLYVAHNTASEIVRRLREKGLVEKKRRSDDERVVEVVLTQEGKRILQQHTGLDVGKLSAVLDNVESDQRTQIEQALALLLQIVRGDSGC